LIATHLPGRTEGQVKNRYYSSIKKRLESSGAPSQASATRSVSQTVVTSPQVEEEEAENFDFGYEFDANMMNRCPSFVIPETVAQNNNQFSGFMVSKGPYAFEEESEESSTQSGGNSHMESPFRYGEAPAMYESSNNFFFGQPQAQDPFFLPPIEHDNQIDDMLDKVSSYLMDKSPVSADVDSYFSDDLRSENEKLSQLSRRKAYLELALAKTLKEIKGL